MLLWDLLGKFPGTDYESFNYEWVIGKLKELKDSVAAALASEQAAAESAEEAHRNLLATIVQATRAERAATNAADSADDAAQSASSIANVVDQVNVNSGRIDNLIATAGDGTIPSELTDLRIGADGHTYDTAGAAVRTNDDYSKRYADTLESLVWFPNAYRIINTGEVNENQSGWTTSELYPISDESTITVNITQAGASAVEQISFFDITKNYISNASFADSPITPPDGAAYVAFTLSEANVTNKAEIKIDQAHIITSIKSDLLHIDGKRAITALFRAGTNRCRPKCTSLNTGAYIAVCTQPDEYDISIDWYDSSETLHSVQWAKYIDLTTLQDVARFNTYIIRKVDNSQMAENTLLTDIITLHDIDKTTVYVSTTGNDDNPGTRSAPFRTVQAAITSGASDIRINPGTYQESLTIIDDVMIQLDPQYTFNVIDTPDVIIDAGNAARGISAENIKSITLKNITFKNAGTGIYLRNIPELCFENVGVDTVTNGHGYDMINCSGTFTNCWAKNIGTMGGSAHRDGFNIHGTGNTVFIGCMASYCEDDGISHHDACTGEIIGGEYHHCGKGGVASPTHGARVNIQSVYSHHNLFGIYAENDFPDLAKEFNVSNCALKNNNYDLIVTNNTCNIWNTPYTTVYPGSAPINDMN